MIHIRYAISNKMYIFVSQLYTISLVVGQAVVYIHTGRTVVHEDVFSIARSSTVVADGSFTTSDLRILQIKATTMCVSMVHHCKH